MADPAQDDDLDQQTLADQAENTTQAPEAGEKVVAEEKADPSENDPLVMAQMSVETDAAKPEAGEPAPTTSIPAKPGKPAAAKTKPDNTAQNADTAKSGDDESDLDDPDIAEAVSDLAKEDWDRLTHKGKSQFLSQRKAVKALTLREKEARKAAKAAEENYQTVEKFVQDAGLSHDEYLETVVVSSLAKRGDPRAIPVLEERLRAVRKAAGIPEPTMQGAELDADLAAVLKDAEDFGIDTTKVRAKYQGKPEAKPQQTAAPIQQTVTPAQQQAQPSAPRELSPEEAQESDEIEATLMGLGIPREKVVEHVSLLMQADPTLYQQPLGKRLRAVILAHHKSAAAKTATPARGQSAPISGRGGPTVRTGANTTKDPVALATMPRGR
jgi:hypothetical protein